MRGQNPFSIHDGGLISSYTARLAESIAVRRAGLEARAARAEAEMSIRARSDFLANMNHELRTPLNAILGFSTMLRDSETYSLSDDQRHAYAEYIIQSADLLLGHINTILETAALDSGAVDMQAGEVDLSAALAGAVSRAEIAAKAADVKILNKTQQGEFLCWADEARLGQALDHLLRTSLKSAPKGSNILVRASEDERSRPQIAIRDFGPGLSDDEVRKALSVFDEVHRGLDRSFSGPGVELAVAKTFVEMQGGRFEIKSRAGQGTISRITMPQLEERSAEQPSEAPLRKAG